MPEMNGFEATDYIRNTMNSKIPIIALTADVTTMDLAKCKDAGMNDYLAKPIDERLLHKKIVDLAIKPTSTKPGADSIPTGQHEENVVTTKNKKIGSTNMAYLRRHSKSNPTWIMEMISIYLKQTPTLIDAMKQGLRDKDWSTVNRAAHKLIPSFSIMGISSEYESMTRKIQEFAAQLDGAKQTTA